MKPLYHKKRFHGAELEVIHSVKETNKNKGMKKIGVFLVVLVFCSLVMRAQDQKQWFIDAEYFFMNDDYEKALPLYQKINEADTSNYNVIYRIGLCYLNTPLKIFKAIPYLDKASKHVSLKYKEGSYKEKNASIESFFQLGFTHQIVNQFDEAIAAYTSYRELLDVKSVFEIDKTERRIESCKRARELVKKPRYVEIENIGNKVNSIYSEFNPCVSGNDSVMYFTRVLNKGKDHKSDDVFIENYRIMQTVKENGTWGVPSDMTEALKSDGRYKTISTSADGKLLVLYRDEYEAGRVGEIDFGSLFYCVNNGKSWSAIQKFPSPINTNREETSGFISNDGTVLYFTSDREGGQGGMDIYKSVKDAAGNWSTPQNLGGSINTTYDEESPMVVNDSLLFFSSDGHDNMGGKDIFYSKLTKEGWSVPVNMSVPVNSAHDDVFFVPTKDGKEAYYAVERHEGYITFGKKDIYHIVIEPKEEEPTAEIKENNAIIVEKVDTLSMVTGHIIREDNGVLSSKISVELTSIKTGEKTLEIEPDYEKGTFSMKVLPGDYQLIASGDIYEKNIQNIHVPEGKGVDLKVEVKLIPKQVSSGEYLAIKAVYFDYAKSELTREAMIELQRVIDLMQANPALYIEVKGYTDSKGSAEYNKHLSLKRSKTVVDYLSSKGISQKRFVTKGMGEIEEIPSKDGNDNPESQKLHRKVEMKVISTDNKDVDVKNASIPDEVKYADKVLYSVIVSAEAKKLDKTTLNKLNNKGLGTIKELRSGSNYVYYVGELKEKAEAVSLLNKVLEQGYAKAEITDNFKLRALAKEQETTSVEATGRYVIQLRAQFRPSDIATSFVGLKGVRESFGPDGYYRYLYGDFSALSDAKAECSRLRVNGYVDAYVTNAEKIVEASKTSSPGAIYTIQIHASYTRIKPNTFGDLKDVEERFKTNGLYRYIYGRYSTWNEAKEALDMIKKRGFEGAFISSMARYK